MSYSNILDLIGMLSIVLAAFLGVLGTLTETRKKTGELSVWGKIAVAGILLTNTFAFVDNYLKQKEEEAHELATQVQEKEKAESELAFQKSVIARADTSLKTQMQLQSSTSTLLKDLNALAVSTNDVGKTAKINLESQNQVLSQQKTLSEKQNSLLTEIKRNIYKIENASLSFEISYSIDADRAYKNFATRVYEACYAKMKADPPTSNHTIRIDSLGISFFCNADSLSQILEINISGDSPLLTSAWLSFNDHEMNELSMAYYLSKDSATLASGGEGFDLGYSTDIWNEENKSYKPLNKGRTNGKSEIRYKIDALHNRLHLWIITSRLQKHEGSTRRIVSLLDLPDSYLRIDFYGRTALLDDRRLEFFQLQFGENSSQHITIEHWRPVKIDNEVKSFFYKMRPEDVFKD